MSNKPTVFIICPFFRPNTGGVESHLKKLTEYLVIHGHKVIVSTYQPLMSEVSGEPVEQGFGGKLMIYRQSWFGRGWFNKLEAYFPLVFVYLFPGLLYRSLIVYLQYWRQIDVIHAHGFAAAAVTLVLRRLHTKRVVVSTHAIYHFRNRPLLAWVMKRILSPFDVILAVGQPSQEEIIEVLGIDDKKVRVHPNWLDTKVFVSPGRARAKQALGLKGFVVLFVGRLIEKKGAKVLLEVAKKLSHITVVFIGDGEMEAEVKEAAQMPNSNVVVVGRLSQNNPQEFRKMLLYYSAADVMASPVQYDEGFATVYLEALSCGTPILTAHRGQLPFFLTHEIGVLLDEATEAATQRQLEQWLTKPNELNQLKRAARVYAVKHFSDKNVKVITDSYQQRKD